MDDAIAGRSAGRVAGGGPDQCCNRASDAQKGELTPWQRKEWCIPPEHHAGFVWRLEDGLDLYEAPADPTRPQVCFDAMPSQLLSATRSPQPVRPGTVARQDYEDQREGTANGFRLFAPELGWRHGDVTERRTSADCAQQRRALVDEPFPAAAVIRVVLDTLNTHTGAARSATLAPEEAQRILRKLEFHSTPTHGSWLKQAELELSVLSDQCLARRIGDWETLRAETAAWEGRRHAVHATVDWRFTTAKARVKLHRVYPVHS